MFRGAFVWILASVGVVHAGPPKEPQNATTPGQSLRTVLAWQIGLERAGFSPGVLDGRLGPKTKLALSEFQRARGLPSHGRMDSATANALVIDHEKALSNYRIQTADFAEIDPSPPRDWIGKSQRKRLGYESLAAALAERFHCTVRLLNELNPGRSLDDRKVGDTIVVPGIVAESTLPLCFKRESTVELEIDLKRKVIRVLDHHQRTIALYHCSIASDKSKRPSGQAKVAVISSNPDYLFDPKMWPEVKGIPNKLVIPPGPRNPVGRCWIGLNLPGYGIHGTPNPELIGKTGSHGCFRLTNWDAQRLGSLVRVGMPVRFLE